MKWIALGFIVVGLIGIFSALRADTKASFDTGSFMFVIAGGLLVAVGVGTFIVLLFLAL